MARSLMRRTSEQGEMLLANDRKGLFYDFVGSPARGVVKLFVDDL